MIPGYAANSDSRMSSMVVPKDSMVAVSVHSYDPMDFCMTYPGVSTFTETSVIDNMFNLVASTFVKKGIPVVLGEWASLNKNNLAEREKHAAYFAKDAKAARVAILLWDNGSTAAGSSGMGYLTRSVPTWAFPSIIQAIAAGVGATSIHPASAAVVPEALEMSHAADGIRFSSTTDCDRFVLTGVDGRSIVLPGGNSGFIPTGKVPAGVYALRAESASGARVEKVLIGP